jgi:hypothetical protein
MGRKPRDMEYVLDAHRDPIEGGSRRIHRKSGFEGDKLAAEALEALRPFFDERVYPRFSFRKPALQDLQVFPD